MNTHNLKNIGPKTAHWLEAINIQTHQDLKRYKLDQIYFKLKSKGYPVNLNFVYALDGALQNRDWRDINPKRKTELKEKLENSPHMSEEDALKYLMELKNIGKKMSHYFFQAGFKTKNSFLKSPIDQAWKKIKTQIPKYSDHPAYKKAVYGAHANLDWRDPQLNLE